MLEGKGRQAVLVRFAAANTRALMYLYYCLRCGHGISEYIPHRFIKDESFVDLDVWCPESRECQYLRARFVQIAGVLRPATVEAPAPGEVPDDTVAAARDERLDYFVDEAGDTTLFGRKYRVMIGTSGVSRTFALGAACIADYAAVTADLTAFRRELLEAREWRGIASLDVERARTAIMFHASKDHPRVRTRVYEILAQHKVSVLVVLRRKAVLVASALARAKDSKPSFTKSDDQREYDSMVARLFKDRLHLAKQTNIIIARRGTSNRDVHLKKAVETAKRRFEKKWGVLNLHEINTKSGEPTDHIGLQVIDYYLWALQRVFEVGDFRHYTPLQSAYRLVIDVDDRRASKAGTYFTATNPLTPESLMPFEG